MVATSVMAKGVAGEAEPVRVPENAPALNGPTVPTSVPVPNRVLVLSKYAE